MLLPTPYAMITSLTLGGKDGAHVLIPIVPQVQRPTPEFLPPSDDPRLTEFATLDAGTSSGYGEISSVDRNPHGEVKVVPTNSGGSRMPWGTETYRGNDRTSHVRRPSREYLRTRYASHGGDLGGPCASVGGRAVAPVGGRRATAGENLERYDTSRSPTEALPAGASGGCDC